MQRLTNTVRRYAWGTTYAIPDLLGVEPDGDPQAELWLGAHPDSPSVLPDGRRLDDAVRGDPHAMLGDRVVEAFGDRLPFLLKVLSAAGPLSLQVHPTREQAVAGFAADERAGIPADAPHRRYRDEHHKPEMVVALTPFEALCGLRPPAVVRDLLGTLDVEGPAFEHLLDLLSATDDTEALRGALEWLLGGDAAVASLVQVVVTACRERPEDVSLRTAVELSEAFGGDPGVLVSLLLHRVSLAPGEALHLDAGNVHAYLSGTAVEVMASSDNVLRAGLTAKHVDVEELLRLVDFTVRPVPRVVPDRQGPLTWYRPGAAEFELARVDLAEGGEQVEIAGSGPRVLLVLDGDLRVRAGEQDLPAARGASFFVAAADGPIGLRGNGSAVLAAVPQEATSA